MHADKWRRKTLPSIRAPSPLPIPQVFTEDTDAMESKKPRAFSKALRSLSNSSIESLSHSPSRSSTTSRRLQKTHSGSGSMIDRIHRRVSSHSPISASPPDVSGAPVEVPYTSMEIAQHGPLKADVSLLKARSEYLVLTDQCLIKFGSLEAAKGVFPQLGQPVGKRSSAIHHSNNKPTASDLRLEIPLRSIVAVFNEEGSSPRFGIEIWWAAHWPRISYAKIHIYFSLPHDRDEWLAQIQRTCRLSLRRNPSHSLVPNNLKARISHIVETYEPTAPDGSTKILTFPVAKRILGLPQKTSSSTDEAQHLGDASSFYVVLGPCMCYFLEVLKADTMTPAGDLRVKVQSFGTVTITRFKASVASQEQRFVMSFRLPFGRETRLELASIHYRRIIETMTKLDRELKPMWPQHLQQAIFDVKGLPPPLQLTSGNDLGGLKRSLNAYCAAFHAQVPRWTIEWDPQSQAAFRLLPSGGSAYSPLQLLAVFRALRYNSYFKALSFRDVDLSSLIGRHDYSQYGDSVVYNSLNGRRISEDHYDLLMQAPILVLEIHALIFSSESIRSIDLRNVLGSRSTISQPGRPKVDPDYARKLTSEVFRPILWLLRYDACRCHSIALSGNVFSQSDVEDLSNLLVLDQTYLKKLEIANCGLGDAGLAKVWTTISGQAASLEALDTSNNQGTVKFDIIHRSLNDLRVIKKLNIAGNTRLPSEVALFNEAVLNSWALEELDLSGIALNDETVDMLASYLRLPSSLDFRVLRLNNCGLNGRQVAQLFWEMGQARKMTVYVNGNPLDEGIDNLCEAISCGFGPWSLFMEMVEFSLENSYIKLLRALTVSKTIECLSLAGTATIDSSSEATCEAVSDFFSDNDTVRFLDLSGFDSKLDEGHLGQDFSRALSGLRSNMRIEHLRIRSQMLNVNIGDLAEAISANKTLHSLDCEDNGFNLSNFRHLVRHLADNATIRYFSAFKDSDLSQTIQKSIDKAMQTATSTRRHSMISMFRPEKITPPVSQPLAQQLREGWEDATQTLQQILRRNRLLFQEGQDGRIELSEHGALQGVDGDDVFSKDFGGLARRAFESPRLSSRCSSGHLPKRSSTISSATSMSRLLPDPQAVRSYSLVSSDEAGSPAVDSQSTGSAIPTPPEMDSPLDREYSLGNQEAQETSADDAHDYDYSFTDTQDADFGLELQAHRRFWSDEAGCIEEEDNGIQINERRTSG
ncbi:hypothetical protein QQZ08_008169 [Neonectria magnoliae]|uniref:LRR-containing protein second PH domain-containing protein n=1 Tax=Neonectria magnoliae TaxID=2732573 RepID=A0ABR1HW13_9HYPO